MRESEEIIEGAIRDAISAAVDGILVDGPLNPAQEGVLKHSEDTYIGVTVDIASQELDTVRATPMTYSVSVSVNVAYADDKTGTLFRDTCRAVRGVLSMFLGDGCSAISTDEFRCDAFMLNGTTTRLDLSVEGGAMTKTYAASTVGVAIANNNNEEAR